MKILILGTAYPLRGGIAHFNALLAQHLGSHHRVETITFKRQYPKFLFPGKTQDEAGQPIPGVDPAPQLVDSVNPFNWIRVAREIRRRQPDLILFKFWLPFFGPCFGTIARLAKRGTRAKVLFVCDNIIPHERRPGDVAFTRYAFGAADCFIVQSDAVERDLNTYFPNSVYRKVPHPVYELFGSSLPKAQARQKLGISAERVILYFGYVRPYKGVDILIEAMHALSDSRFQIGDSILLIVGEFYDDETRYRRQVKQLGLENSIRFVSEYVANEAVATYFSAADVVVLPYRSATQSGIAQIAYQFDTPVIATNVGGLAEVVIDETTGFLVPSNDPTALAGAIWKFYTEEREAQFVENVKREKLKYSWENLVHAIESLMEESQ
jgi:glycosyltransferase involved in cell wall biosynthesis